MKAENQLLVDFCGSTVFRLPKPRRMPYDGDRRPSPKTQPAPGRERTILMEIKLCENIRALRQSRGINQETLAEALSVSTQAVSKWETGVSLR